MKKITLYFSLLFIICSCSLEDDLVYTKPDNPVKSEFKLSEQEVVYTMTDFLGNFYSEETSTRNEIQEEANSMMQAMKYRKGIMERISNII